MDLKTNLIRRFFGMAAAVLLIGTLIIGYWVTAAVENGVKEKAIPMKAMFVGDVISPLAHELGSRPCRSSGADQFTRWPLLAQDRERYRHERRRAPADGIYKGRSMISIIIADDHPIFRQGLALTLGEAEDFRLCTEVGTAEDPYRSTVKMRTDLLISDLSTPGGGQSCLPGDRAHHVG